MIFKHPKKQRKRWLRDFEIWQINKPPDTHLDHMQKKEKPKTPRFSPLRQQEVPSALPDTRDKRKDPLPPEEEQRKARAVDKADKPVPRVFKPSNGSTLASPVVQGGMQGIEKLLRDRKQLDDQVSTSRESDDANLHRQTKLLKELGKYGESEELYRLVLAVFDEEFGPDHPDVATVLQSLTNVYYMQKKNGEADPLDDHVLAIYDEKLGPDHPDVARTLSKLGNVHHGDGEYKKAEPLYRRALKIFERKLGPDHPEAVRVRNKLADLHEGLG